MARMSSTMIIFALMRMQGAEFWTEQANLRSPPHKNSWHCDLLGHRFRYASNKRWSLVIIQKIYPIYELNVVKLTVCRSAQFIYLLSYPRCINHCINQSINQSMDLLQKWGCRLISILASGFCGDCGVGWRTPWFWRKNDDASPLSTCRPTPDLTLSRLPKDDSVRSSTMKSRAMKL